MSNLDSDMERELNGLLRSFEATTAACKFCGQSITFKDRIPFEGDGREHRCLQRTQRAYTCFRCQAPIQFNNRVAMNANGTQHRCIAEARAAARRPSAEAKPAPRVDPETGELFGLDA